MTKWKIQNNDGTFWQIDFNSKEEADLYYRQISSQNKGQLANAPHKLVEVKK
jgi:hypothetical protein